VAISSAGTETQFAHPQSEGDDRRDHERHRRPGNGPALVAVRVVAVRVVAIRAVTARVVLARIVPRDGRRGRVTDGGVPRVPASEQALHGHADSEGDEETTEYERVVPRSHLQCAAELIAARGHGERQADSHEGAPRQQVGTRVAAGAPFWGW
jgi:hypothetical protein